MIFQSFATPSACSTLNNHQKIWPKMEEKPCSTSLKPISPTALSKPETPITQFWGYGFRLNRLTGHLNLCLRVVHDPSLENHDATSLIMK